MNILDILFPSKQPDRLDQLNRAVLYIIKNKLDTREREEIIRFITEGKL